MTGGLSILGAIALRLSRGDSLSYHNPVECGPFFMVACDDADEDIVRMLVADGAVVSRPRERIESRGHAWHRSLLDHGGVSYEVTTRRRPVSDLVAEIDAWQARVAAGETLPAIARGAR